MDGGTAALPELVMYGYDVVGACNRVVGVCVSPLSAVGFEPAIPVLCGCVSWELEGVVEVIGVGGVVSMLTVAEVFVSQGPVGKETHQVRVCLMFHLDGGTCSHP